MDIGASIFRSFNDAYKDIVDSFDEVVYLVNSKSGWTFYWWCKRGLIKYVNLLGNDIKEPGDNKVLSKDISTIVVHIHPSKKDYINISTIHGRSLDNLKFDFFTL